MKCTRSFTLDRATATQRYRANQFHVYVTSWTNDIPDPSQLAAYELGFTESESYHSGYKSAEMDALLARGMRETNQEKRRQNYERMQDILADENPWIMWWQPNYLYGLHKSVQWTPIGNLRMDLRRGNLSFTP